MKPPKCRLCGHEHALGAEHVFPDTPPRVTSKVVKPAINVNHHPVSNVTNAAAKRRVTNGGTDDVARVRAWRRANRSRYNAQQRERMRLWRAARREAGA